MSVNLLAGETCGWAVLFGVEALSVLWPVTTITVASAIINTPAARTSLRILMLSHFLPPACLLMFIY
jgi:hypothetical protein